jgi:type IV pilus biogenesis protein PilP
VGFFVLKFMTLGETEMASERAQSAPRTEKKISKPQKKEPEKSPLFEALEALKDPFRGEAPQLVELQNKIVATKKEIEFLKASLEEKKLRQEIKELEKSISGAAVTSTPEAETEIGSTHGEKGEARSENMVLVKAILITDDEKSALIVSGGKETWVHEGEEFDGWEIKEITKDSVVFLRAGKTFVFFYDRPSISKKGES